MMNVDKPLASHFPSLNVRKPFRGGEGAIDIVQASWEGRK